MSVTTMVVIVKYLGLFIYPLLVILVLWVMALLYCFKGFFSKYKIQPEFPKLKKIAKDAFVSIFTFYFFIPAGFFVCYCSTMNKGLIYHHVSDKGLPYFFLSLALLIVLQDTYYYWLHRFMHTRFMFRHVHVTHHRSSNPTLVSFYAIHPIEAFCMSLVMPMAIFMFPVSDLAFMMALPMFTLQSMISHSGYEWLPYNKLTRWFNSASVHVLHHQKVGVNYGYYFVIWDWLCGTLDKASWPLFKAMEEKRKGSTKRLKNFYKNP